MYVHFFKKAFKLSCKLSGFDSLGFSVWLTFGIASVLALCTPQNDETIVRLLGRLSRQNRVIADTSWRGASVTLKEFHDIQDGQDKSPIKFWQPQNI